MPVYISLAKETGLRIRNISKIFHSAVKTDSENQDKVWPFSWNDLSER